MILLFSSGGARLPSQFQPFWWLSLQTNTTALFGTLSRPITRNLMPQVPLEAEEDFSIFLNPLVMFRSHHLHRWIRFHMATKFMIFCHHSLSLAMPPRHVCPLTMGFSNENFQIVVSPIFGLFGEIWKFFRSVSWVFSLRLFTFGITGFTVFFLISNMPYLSPKVFNFETSIFISKELFIISLVSRGNVLIYNQYVFYFALLVFYFILILADANQCSMTSIFITSLWVYLHYYGLDCILCYSLIHFASTAFDEGFFYTS